jgi:micrococcal nuclease
MKIFKRLLLGLILSLAGLNLYALDTATVIRVIDGDTLKIECNGKRERVSDLLALTRQKARLTTRHTRMPIRPSQDINTITALGKRSTAFTKGLMSKGDKVSIEFDVERRDRYKRLLGYVYLSNGKMLNEEIIKAGYASLMTIPPNVRYVGRFQRAYKRVEK